MSIKLFTSNSIHIYVAALAVFCYCYKFVSVHTFCVSSLQALSETKLKKNLLSKERIGLPYSVLKSLRLLHEITTWFWTGNNIIHDLECVQQINRSGGEDASKARSVHQVLGETEHPHGDIVKQEPSGKSQAYGPHEVSVRPPLFRAGFMEAPELH